MSLKFLSSLFFPLIFLVVGLHPIAAQTDVSRQSKFVHLTAATVETFIDQAFSAPKKLDESIRQEVHKAGGDTLIVQRMIEQFYQSRQTDYNRSLVILSLLGEMGTPLAIEFYQNILDEVPESPDKLPGEYLSQRDLLEMLQAKAIQSLAYVKSSIADSIVLHLVVWHPAVAVRSAGIDAYLFNHDDSKSAKEKLRSVLDESAWIYIDRVRRKKSIVNKSLDEDLENFYNKYPDQVAPVNYSPRGNRVTNFLNFRSFLFLSALFILVFLVLRKFLRRDIAMRDYLSRHP